MNPPSTFQVGDIVVHKFLGAGKVTRIAQSSGGTQFLVQFRATVRWLYADNLKPAPRSNAAARTAKAAS